MSLIKDIAKLTAPPSGDNVGVKFMPLNGRGRAEQDLNMNNRPVRLRNGHNRSLYEERLEATECDDVVYDEKWMDEIRSSVRAVNGGEFSNAHLEQHIKKRQLEAKKLIKKAQSSQSSSQSRESVTTLSSNTTASTFVSCNTLENEPEKNLDAVADNFESNRLYRNGVIRGLLHKNIISIADLDMSDNTKAVVEEGAIAEENKQESYCPRVDLVQHPEDPDLLMHPLQAYGKLDYVQDFVLERIGTKKTMTPRQYFLNLDDSAFEFVKRSN